MTPIGIVIPTMNNYQGLIKLINSSKSQFGLLDFYIIDNTDENKGVSRAWNEGWKYFENKKKYIMFIGDDVILDRTTIDDLLYEYILNEDKKIIINSAYSGKTDNTTRSKIGADYSCFMMRNDIQMNDRATIKFSDLIGYFDEEFYPAYFEDNDMDYRVKLKGWKTFQHVHIKYAHEGSHTLNSLRGTDKAKTINEGFLKNQDRYKKKWGGLPGQETFEKPFNGEPQL
jgi:GT2 family glycosyltransferase